MERSEGDTAPGGAPRGAGAAAPSVRDASAIIARVHADEKAASQARDLYRTQRMQALEPDAGIAPLLAPEEQVLAVRHGAVFDRRQSTAGTDVRIGLNGSLYVTSQRLVLIGRLTLSFDLDDIEETVLSGEQLLLVMRDGTGVSLEVGQPRLLRVEIGTARAAAREQSRPP